MNDDPFALPTHWRWATFSDVARVAADLVDPTLTPDVPHIAPNHIESWTGTLLPYKTIREDGMTSAKHRFHRGQILYSKIRPYLAKATLAAFDGLCSADMYPIETDLEPAFLLRWMLTPTFTNEASGSQGRTVLPKINRDALARLRVPVAPLNEQRRIVAKLDAIFEQTRAAKSRVERLPALLDKLKRSILTTAFCGDLTADWRAAHPNVEPASALLDRIRTERRSSWEAELRAKGKDPMRADYSEPTTVLDADALPELPPKWVWIRFPELLADRGMRTGPFGTLLSKDEHRLEGVPVLGIENIGELRFIAGSKVHIDSEKADSLVEYEAHAGDLLVSRSGTVGEVCVVPHNLGRAIISTNIIRVTPDSSIVEPLFLGYALTGSAHVLSQIERLCSGSTRLFLNQGIMSALVVPIPPLAEQRALLAAISQNLEVLNSLDSRRQRSLELLVRLEQAALAKAFRGELVEQDPSDEPASAYLDRKRSMRATGAAHERSARSARPPTPPKTRQAHVSTRRRRRASEAAEKIES